MKSVFALKDYGHTRNQVAGTNARVGAVLFGEDTYAYMKHLDASIDAFWEDVVRDVCQYGSVITREETKTSTNPFGVIDSETAGYPGWNSGVCKNRGFPTPPASGQKPHVNKNWLTGVNHWVQDWRRYLTDNNFDFIGNRPDRAQLDTWYAQLEGPGGWRELFVKAGGKTLTPVAGAPAKPSSIPWTGILIVGGIVAGVFLLRSIPFQIFTKRLAT